MVVLDEINPIFVHGILNLVHYSTSNTIVIASRHHTVVRLYSTKIFACSSISPSSPT